MSAFGRTALVFVVGVVLASVAWIAFLPGNGPVKERPVVRLPASARQAEPISTDESTVVSEVYDRVSAAVVNITFTAEASDIFGRPLRQEGTGSGFLIDTDGHVVTNQHVISGATRLDITLPDGTSHIGEVMATDAPNDLALVRIQAPPEKLERVTVAPLGDSSALRVGQTVVAIGNPFGLERSATLGIISSVGRTRPGVDQRLITNMIQTDAAINPGNSGGPLLNLRGEVVGINAQIEAPSRGNVGIGFAIPVNTLKRYLPDLVAGREPKHAWLGIAGRALTPTLAERLGSPVQQGVILVSLVTNGPAARAGLRGASRNDASTADIVTEIDGYPVRSVEDVAVVIDEREPGDTVRVTYLREGQTQTSNVTLGVWEGRDASLR